MSTINTGRRPNRSANRPNTNAPKGRAASVSTEARATAFTSEWNSAAMALNMKTIRKKSKASSDQPRNEAITALFWLRSRPFRSARTDMTAPLPGPPVLACDYGKGKGGVLPHRASKPAAA